MKGFVTIQYTYKYRHVVTIFPYSPVQIHFLQGLQREQKGLPVPAKQFNYPPTLV